MKPEYLEELADLADPHSLWRMTALDQLGLPAESRRQLDTGIALRRMAEHVRRVRALLGTGKSLVITPLSESGSATMTIDAPPRHQKLLAMGPEAAGATAAPRHDDLAELSARFGASSPAHLAAKLALRLKEAEGVVSILYAALDDASTVVDKDDGEDYAYQAELEVGAGFLGIERDAGNDQRDAGGDARHAGEAAPVSRDR